MHEMAIVESIMEIVEQQAKIYNANKVISVNLEFGALTGVMPSAVEFAFEVLSKGSVAEGATLRVEIIPIKIMCHECGVKSVLEEYAPVCPACGCEVVTIIQGRNEMRVASLELDDPQ
jgi:hydrogenase nickel incorporation protein HypA/HybF